MYIKGEKYRLRRRYAEVIQHDKDAKAIVEYGIVVSETNNLEREDGSCLVLAKCHITDGTGQGILWLSYADLKEMFEPEPYLNHKNNTAMKTMIDDGLIDPKKDNRGEGDIIPPKPKKQPEPGTKGPLND